MLHVSRKHCCVGCSYGQAGLASVYSRRNAETDRPEQSRRENMGTLGCCGMVESNNRPAKQSHLRWNGGELLESTDRRQRCHHRVRHEFRSTVVETAVY